MGLLSLFQRNPGRPAAAAASADGGPVASARSRARRRLIGAVVLVAAGVIGFPLLFDRAPRPVAADIPIEIPRKDGQPPLAVPAVKPGAGAASVAPARDVADAPAEATREAASATTATPAATTAKPVAKADDKALFEKKPEPVAAEKPPAPPAPARSGEAARAQAALEGRTPAAEVEAAAGTGGRFVVQVGAFSEAESAREARARVEKLGLKTYTQVVDTAAGKRIRVRLGPYGDRAEAEKAVARLKQAGLNSAVLTL